MTPDELQRRAKLMSLRVMKVAEAVGSSLVGRILATQLLKSGTSVSANYRAARRARSKKEFIAKLGVVVEEADETVHWLEMAAEGGLVSTHKISPLKKEAEELVAIFARMRYTARTRSRKVKGQDRN